MRAKVISDEHRAREIVQKIEVSAGYAQTDIIGLYQIPAQTHTSVDLGWVKAGELTYKGCDLDV